MWKNYYFPVTMGMNWRDNLYSQICIDIVM